MALTSAMAFRASARSRAALGRLDRRPGSRRPIRPTPPTIRVPLEDLAPGSRRLSSYAMIALTLLATAWIWDLDLALGPLPPQSAALVHRRAVAAVTLGNLTEAAVIVLLGASPGDT